MENVKANYERVSKDIEKELAKRAKARAAIENEIAGEMAKLQELEQKKAELLMQGQKDAYLKAASDASIAESTLAFLKGRKGIVFDENKIQEDFLKACKKDIKAEQDRITRKALNQIKAKYEEIRLICSDAIKSQDAGSNLLQKLFRAFAEDAPAEAARIGGADMTNYYKYSCAYGLNYLIGIMNEAEKAINNFNMKYETFMKGEEAAK